MSGGRKTKKQTLSGSHLHKNKLPVAGYQPAPFLLGFFSHCNFAAPAYKGSPTKSLRPNVTSNIFQLLQFHVTYTFVNFNQDIHKIWCLFPVARQFHFLLPLFCVYCLISNFTIITQSHESRTSDCDLSLYWKVRLSLLCIQSKVIYMVFGGLDNLLL